MARAMTAGELQNIRKDNQWSELYLAVHIPDTIWTGRVNGAPSSNDEVASITVDTGAWGSGYSSAIKDMLMYVGSSAGAYDKGFVRIREDLSGTVTSIDIGETSEIDWANNDYLTIVDEFPIAPRHIRIDSSQVVYMDYDLTYASQSDPHDDPDPVPVLGPSLRVAWLTGSSVDVDFDASDSWTFDGTITGYAWTRFPTTGSSLSGASTATPTFTATQAGTWRLSCIVSGSNGKSYTAYRYVKVYDTNNMPIQSFVLNELAGNWESGGWNARVTLYDEVDLTEIRKGTMVALFARDYYGNTESSQGPITDAETILMIGWIANESINWDPEAGSVTLEIQGPHYWLGQMNGFPSGLEWVGSDAATWPDMKNLTLRKGAWHFVHWRTTLTRIIDFQIADDSREFSLFNASPGTLWSQLTSESFATIMAHPCCDRFGRLFIEIEPQVLTAAARASVPTVMSVTTADLRRPVNIERRTIPTVGLVDLSGVVYSAGVGSPLFSLSPGHIFKRLGAGAENVERLALSSQNQANTLAGHILGWRNIEYPNVSLPFACNQRMVDITPHQYLSLVISAGDTIRGIATTLTLVPRSVSFTHDPTTGSLVTDVQAESASVEQASLVGDPPPEPPDPAPPPLPAPDPIPEPVLVPGWPATVYAATRGDTTESTYGNIYKTTDFTGPSGGQPTWTKLAATGLPSTRYIRDFNADADDKENDLYVLISQTSPTTDTDHELYYSSDGGANFSKIMDNSDASTEAGLTGKIFEFGVDPSNAGSVWVTFKTDTNYGGESGLLVSDDYGSTWSYYTVKTGGWNYECRGVRGAGEDVWVTGCWGSSSSVTWYITHDGGSSWTRGATIGTSVWYTHPHYNQITTSCYMAVDGSSWGDDLGHSTSDTTYAVDRDSDDIPPSGRYGMYISINDADKMWLINGDVIYYTDDAWSSMTSGSAMTWNTGGIGWCGDCDGDDDYKRIILFNDDAGDDVSEDPESVFVTEDWGATLTNKSGANYNTGPSYTDAIPSIEGGLAAVVVVDRDLYH